MTSKNGLIRTLFEEYWLWVINLALRTPGGEGGRLNADNCGQGGGGSKIGKILRMSFMDGLQHLLVYTIQYTLYFGRKC